MNLTEQQKTDAAKALSHFDYWHRDRLANSHIDWEQETEHLQTELAKVGLAIQGTSYESIRSDLKNLPTTWYPGLIRAICTAAVKQGVFVPGGLTRFVDEVERLAIQPIPQKETTTKNP